MTPEAFYHALFNEWQAYFVILIFVFLLYFVLLKNRIESIFDPLFLGFLFSAFGAADVYFLFAFDLIRPYYFFSYCATQTAFLIGFLLFPPISPQYAKCGVALPNRSSVVLLYVISALCFIILQIFSYWKRGIPIFLDSRLENYYNQGIIGSFLNKALEPIGLITSVLSLHFLVAGRGGAKLFSKFVLVFVIVFAILTGSKSNFYGLITVAFTYYLFSRRFLPPEPIKKLKVLFHRLGVMAVIVAILIVVFKLNNSNPLVYLGLRLIQSGDSYFYAYGNDAINQLTKANFVVALFPGFAKLLGFIGNENVPSLGTELFRIVNKYAALDGPNARHNVFGLAYLGPYWSVAYSFVLGTILGFARSGLYRWLPMTPLGAVVYVVIFISVSGIETDANMAFSNLVGVFSIGVFLFMLSLLLSTVSRVTK